MCGYLTTGRIIVNFAQMVFEWFTQNPFTAASAVFGVGVVVVTLYTYVYDYEALINRD
jgi:hypothetical protein